MMTSHVSAVGGNHYYGISKLQATDGPLLAIRPFFVARAKCCRPFSKHVDQTLARPSQHTRRDSGNGTPQAQASR
jgi:hypothetical protein